MDRNLNDIRERMEQWERNFLPAGAEIAPRALADFIKISLGVYIAERLDTIIERMGEPIDSHPADEVERAGKGECPRCGQVWFECTCEPPDYLKAALR